ncbi:MAG: FecR domain-containing protein [Tannerellaceae bacterium]|nr:FecR domain-containing protein [Tannerellaceae bacterium]
MADELSGATLTPEEKVQLEQWLESDPANPALYKQIKEYWCSEVIEPDDHQEEFIESLLQTVKKKKHRDRLRYVAAACVAALLIAGTWLLSGEWSQSGSGERGITAGTDPDKSYLILSGGTTQELTDNHVTREFYQSEPITGGNHKLIVARRNTASLTLPDGTNARVNSMSRLTFPAEFRGSERRIKLSGEACFDVVENQLKPFIIEFHQGEIAVLGTTLHVMSYDNEGLEITLLSGRVNIHLSDRRDAPQLLPGQQLVVSGSDIRVFDTNNRAVDSWTEDYFDFEGRTLKDIAYRLSKWYGIGIDCDRDTEQGILMGGTMSRRVPIEEFIKVIETTHPVVFEKCGEGYIIKRIQ